MARSNVQSSDRQNRWVEVKAPVQVLDEVARAPLLMLQLDMDGAIQYANENFELVFGWQRGELKGLRAVTLLRPNDVIREIEPDNWRLYDELRSGQREHVSFETHLYARDGHAVRVAVCVKMVQHHRSLQIEMHALSHERILYDHRAQFADPLARLEMEGWFERQRQEKIQQLEKKVDGFEQTLLEAMYAPDLTKRQPKPRQGHRPSKYPTREEFTVALYAAVKETNNVWQPTRREICVRLGAKSENSLKDWLRYFDMLRYGSVARTLKEIAVELGLQGDGFLD